MENQVKFKAKTDVPVLLIFFSRNEQFQSVFDEVKKARPSKLYLYQDGAREGNESDRIGVEKCRATAADENIDWDCEVHRFYQEKNVGCDPSEFIAQKWMFETEEMGIVLEDDDVPSQSFFPFCKDLLERYKDDKRVNMICGMNNNDISKHVNASFLFTKKGSIWGWASWKRVLDTWDEHYTWLDDAEKLNIIKTQLTNEEYESFIATAKQHKNTGRAHYESINAAAMFINESLNIVPKYNMITNIGISPTTTHSVSDLRLLPKRTQRLMYKKRYEIEFPLVYPKSVQRDYKFEKQMTPNKLERIGMKAESLARSFVYLGFKKTVNRIRKKVNGR
mgnify:FL=1